MFNLNNIEHKYNGQSVLRLPDFAGAQGEHWLVLGYSGSGKTTLLHIMAGVLRPSQGEVTVAGERLHALQGSSLDRFRGANIGIVFQQMHLIATLTVEDNLLLAQYLAKVPGDRDRVQSVLDSLDIGDKAQSYPSQLSYGQQQRVSIARAVINSPKIILADEPTSSLDDLHCGQVIDLLVQQAQKYQATLVITTHDQRVKSRFTRQLNLSPEVPA